MEQHTQIDTAARNEDAQQKAPRGDPQQSSRSQNEQNSHCDNREPVHELQYKSVSKLVEVSHRNGYVLTNKRNRLTSVCISQLITKAD